MHVLVFGAGSLGSLLGGLLAREHEVTLVGRDPHVATVRASGLQVTGEYDFVVHPAATTDLSASATDSPASADLAVVAVKSDDTAAAADALADCALDAALSVQNGLGNEERLAEALDRPVLAGTCTYGARLTEPGVVACTGQGEVALGPPDGGRSGVAGAAADRVGRAFDAAGIETTVAGDLPRRRWTKLAVNAGINGSTALARVPNGALVDGPAGEIAREAARETAWVARESGIDLSEEAAVAAMERVAGDTAANRSSTLQDVDAGECTEVDAINGAVVDRAGDAVPVPINRTLTALLRAWECERGLR